MTPCKTPIQLALVIALALAASAEAREPIARPDFVIQKFPPMTLRWVKPQGFVLPVDIVAVQVFQKPNGEVAEKHITLVWAGATARDGRAFLDAAEEGKDSEPVILEGYPVFTFRKANNLRNEAIVVVRITAAE